MDCYIYRCTRKPDLYLYLAGRDDFASVPAGIRNSLGHLEFAMHLELTPQRKLARVDATDVMRNLAEHGFHLQLPESTPIEVLMAKIARHRLT